MKKYLIPAISIIILLLPAVSLALELTYPVIQGLRIELGMDLNKLIAWFYYFIVGIAGIFAFYRLVRGSFMWMASTGNPAMISEAKDQITSAFLGLIIILASFVILKAINPELLTLKLPGLP